MLTGITEKLLLLAQPAYDAFTKVVDGIVYLF